MTDRALKIIIVLGAALGIALSAFLISDAVSNPNPHVAKITSTIYGGEILCTDYFLRMWGADRDGSCRLVDKAGAQ